MELIALTKTFWRLFCPNSHPLYVTKVDTCSLQRAHHWRTTATISAMTKQIFGTWWNFWISVAFSSEKKEIFLISILIRIVMKTKKTPLRCWTQIKIIRFYTIKIVQTPFRYPKIIGILCKGWLIWLIPESTEFFDGFLTSGGLFSVFRKMRIHQESTGEKVSRK